jgi:hypothetical protein
LQFVGGDGTEGTIPELLKIYVWKKPRTHLDALREIVRALPISPGQVDWRTDITGVVTAQTTKSTSTELSAEAKNILRAAASSRGARLMHLRHSGGEVIQTADGQSLIPDQDPRTIARWVGGVEDLQRRRYIVDCGHKGEVFKVTREGFEAADAL